MAMKLEANTANDHTIFEMMSMVRGTMTMDRHYFFNMVKSGGEDSRTLKEFLGGTIPKTEDGKRIPMNKQANNPALASPSVTGMKFFGQSPLFKTAIDQIHAKKIGVFPSPSLGAGLNVMDFQKNPIFNGEGKLMDIVGKILFGGQGSSISGEEHQLFNPMKELSNVIGKAGGADFQTKINPASDTQKLMQMVSAGFAGGTNPFGSSVISDGMDIAKEVQKYIAKLS